MHKPGLEAELERPRDLPPPRAPRYWLLLVFAALLLAPPAWATIAIVGIGIGGLALTRVRPGTVPRERAGGERSPVSGTVLGSDRRGREVVLSDRQLSAHTLILGASGAGKSTTMLSILTDHIRRGRPVIAIDMKGSPAFARELASAAEAAEAPVPALDARRTRPLEPARPRQCDRAQGQAHSHRALHRAALPARRRALRADGSSGAAPGPSRATGHARRGG